MQRFLSGGFAMCRTWPKSPQPSPKASLLESPLALRQFIADQLLAKADVIRAMHERVQLCQDPQTEFALPPRKPRSQPHQSHPASTRPHDPTRNSELQKSTTRLDNGPRKTLPWLHKRQHDAGHTQCRPVRNRIQKSARHRSSGAPGSTQSSQAAHPRQ